MTYRTPPEVFAKLRARLAAMEAAQARCDPAPPWQVAEWAMECIVELELRLTEAEGRAAGHQYGRELDWMESLESLHEWFNAGWRGRDDEVAKLTARAEAAERDAGGACAIAPLCPNCNASTEHLWCCRSCGFTRWPRATEKRDTAPSRAEKAEHSHSDLRSAVSALLRAMPEVPVGSGAAVALSRVVGLLAERETKENGDV